MDPTTNISSNKGEARTETRNVCSKMCQNKCCLPLITLVILASSALAVSLVLLSPSAHGRFPPTLKWWQKSIVYQIYPRSFKDSNGDGVGDLAGIISKLDYFTYLNVGAIWISPFYPSPMRDFGYDTTSHVDVDPLFGTLVNFDTLLAEAHKRGIRVIIDFVAGYTSSDHPWFRKSEQRIKPFDNYYVWTAGRRLDNGTIAPPSNWVSSFGFSAWQWNERRQEYYYHSFTPSQPQVNYRSQELREEMKNIIRFWFERGVDGMRVDAIAYMIVSDHYYQDQLPSNVPGFQPWQLGYWDPSLTQNVEDIGPVVQEWRELLDTFDHSDGDTDDSKYMVVELYDPPATRNRYYDYGADMPFNFDLVGTMNPVYHAHCDAICIRDVIQQEYDTLPEGKWANFVLSNHDNQRANSRLGTQYTDALHVLLLTQRGTPTTYYGEELGMEDIFVTYKDTQDPWGINYGPDHYQEVSRDPARAPMQWDSSPNAGFSDSAKTWLPVHPDYKHVNVQREKNSTSMTTLQVYRDLAVLREQPSLQYGTLTFCHVTQSLLSYLRSAQGFPDYLVVINFGNSTLTHDLSRSPVSQDQGRVKVATSSAVNEGRFRQGSVVSLSDMTLEVGDGLVIEL